MVDADALPDVFRKVIAAKELIEQGTAKNISTAIKMCDLSRSAFYKYKDAVFNTNASTSEKLKLQAVLIDRAGVFSAVSNTLFKRGANIVTVNQSEPENGFASVTIVIGIDQLKVPVNELLKTVERLNGVVSVKTV